MFIIYLQKKNGIPVTLELLEDGAWSKGKTNKYARLNSRNDASTRCNNYIN